MNTKVPIVVRIRSVKGPRKAVLDVSPYGKPWISGGVETIAFTAIAYHKGRKRKKGSAPTPGQVVDIICEHINFLLMTFRSRFADRSDVQIEPTVLEGATLGHSRSFAIKVRIGKPRILRMAFFGNWDSMERRDRNEVNGRRQPLHDDDEKRND